MRYPVKFLLDVSQTLLANGLKLRYSMVVLLLVLFAAICTYLYSTVSRILRLISIYLIYASLTPIWQYSRGLLYYCPLPDTCQKQYGFNNIGSNLYPTIIIIKLKIKNKILAN